jgi:hypothetical protein
MEMSFSNSMANIRVKVSVFIVAVSPNIRNHAGDVDSQCTCSLHYHLSAEHNFLIAVFYTENKEEEDQKRINSVLERQDA